MALRPGADIGHVQRLSDPHPLPGRWSDLRAADRVCHSADGIGDVIGAGGEVEACVPGTLRAEIEAGPSATRPWRRKTAAGPSPSERRLQSSHAR